MFAIVFVTLVLAGTLAGVVYLWDFSRASRCDALFLPACDRRARRARRVTGMYVRDYAHDDVDLYLRRGDGDLVGSSSLRAH